MGRSTFGDDIFIAVSFVGVVTIFIYACAVVVVDVMFSQ